MIKLILQLLFVFVYIYCVFATKPDCQEIIAEGLSKEDEKFVLDKHNKLRTMIAKGKVKGLPKGIDLKKLKYDKKLAEEAQKVADKCVIQYDLYIDDRWDNVGQNLGISESNSATMENETWEMAIQQWFEAKGEFEYGRLSFPCGCLQFTQIVWADTDHLGCGMKHYKTKSGNPKYIKLFVCNYGPAGNVIDEFPYKAGEKGCNKDVCEIHQGYLG